MTSSEAKEYIRTRPTEYLERDKSEKGYVCPLCGSGKGKNGTGITTQDGVHFTCWTGCFSNADIIDIIGLEYNLTTFPEKLERAAEEYKIQIDKDKQFAATPASWNSQANKEPSARPKSWKSQIDKEIEDSSAQETETDYTEFYKMAATNIESTNYYRGISIETLKRFKIGFIENWKHPDASNAPPSPRLIIPTSSQSYLARDTRDNLTEEQKKYAKMKVGKVHLFNTDALNQTEKSIVIVEGEIDALSIIDIGGEAIGLGSTSNIHQLLDLIKDNPPVKPLIIALDNDEAGNKASNSLCAELTEQGIPFYRVDITGNYKDANEALQADREGLMKMVEFAENYELEMLKHESAAYVLEDFLSTEKHKADCYPTGFDNLDTVLDGGLYAGLYIIGAISSLGKTTLALQIADNIAGNGNDVIYFSLEMAKEELIAKSLSRETFKCSNFKGGLTTLQILRRDRYQSYSQNEQESIGKASIEYRKYAGNIYIVEGVGKVTTDVIRSKVEKHIQIAQKRLVVIVDYIQIISPLEPRATDKQNTDKAVLELKRLSRDFDIPVVGISSFNRENYSSAVSFASFKESGGIEYSSDVLIGLQYDGLDKANGSRDEVNKLVKENNELAQKGKAQKIQLKIIKNRNGIKGDVLFNFSPKFNCFVESKDDNNDMVECSSSKWQKI